MTSSHHGSPEKNAELQRLQEELAQERQHRRNLMDQLKGQRKRNYPEGRLGPDDEGELTYAVGPDPEDGIVRLEFDKPVEWLGLPPQQAIELAQSLIRHARTVSTEPLRINLH